MAGVRTGLQSYSQNGEDVVLWRALRGVTGGRYIEVGANDPVKILNEHGLLLPGLERDHGRARSGVRHLQREQRPRDLVIEAAITTNDHDTAVLHVVEGTGLSTLDDAFAEVHARSDYDVTS